MTARPAGLPMYDFPEIRAETDAFWHLVRDAFERHGVADLPRSLTRPEDLAKFWSDPDLLIGQTCGYPLTHGLCGDAHIVATPVYRAEGCAGAFHGSAVIVRRESPIRTLFDAKGHVAAINGYDSNTGMNLFRIALARAGARARFFASVIETGAHRASLDAVRTGAADIAAIDVVTLAHVKRFDPGLAGAVRIVAMTPVTPGLPLITGAASGAETVATLRAALQAVAGLTPRPPCLDALMIDGFEMLDASAYDAVRTLEDEAARLGYTVLR